MNTEIVYSIWDKVKNIGWYTPKPHSLFPFYSVQIAQRHNGAIVNAVESIHSSWDGALCRARSQYEKAKSNGINNIDVFILEHDDYGKFTTIPEFVTHEYFKTHWYVACNGHVPDLVSKNHVKRPGSVHFPKIWTNNDGTLIANGNLIQLYDRWKTDDVVYIKENNTVTWIEDGLKISESVDMFSTRVV